MYARFNNVPLSPSTTAQIRLPFIHGGYGLPSLASTLHESYGASLIDCAPIRIQGPQFPSVMQYQSLARPYLRVVRRNLPSYLRTPCSSLVESDLRCLEPSAVLTRPERIHKILIQAQQKDAASTYWQTHLWDSFPSPSAHRAATIRKRVRYYSLLAPGATSFLTAHPAAASRIYNSTWSIMLRRHLDAAVTHDSISPLRCAHCSRQMDARGDHATMCSHGFGTINRHNTVRNVFSRQVFRAAGLASSIDAPFLIPNTAARPEDILVQPSPPAPGCPPDKPTAYEVTVCSPFRRGKMNQAARHRGGAAYAAALRKRKELGRTICDALLIPDNCSAPVLDWHFQPLAFDTLGASSQCTLQVIDTHAKLMALRNSCTTATAKSRIHQRISFAIWSSVAAAILSRLPTHEADLSYPLEV